MYATPPIRMYGAGAKDAADARLLDEVRSRRAASDATTANVVAAAAKAAHLESADGIQEQLGELRRRRQFLLEELSKNKAAEETLLRKADRASAMKETVVGLAEKREERERKRREAFELKRREGEMGKGPVGVVKRSPGKGQAAWKSKFKDL